MLLSLQHRVAYSLQTCMPEETEEMANFVDAAILKAVHAATCIRFDAEQVTRIRLTMLPTMLPTMLRMRN